MDVCGCDNKTMTDGGGDYIRSGGKDISKVINLSLYENSPEKDIEENLLWGTYGKDGNEPRKWVKLYGCDSEHLQAILDKVPNIGPVHEQTISKILFDRGH